MERCSLVLVEWEDSAQPISGWRYLSDLNDFQAVRCVSVGWLIHDGEDVKALAPNMGEINSTERVQASGIIRIPTRCITAVKHLKEVTVSSLPRRKASGPLASGVSGPGLG